MKDQEKNSIYDRLFSMVITIETKNIPDPRYISEKIGECHISIEEVEKFYIHVSKELSVLRRALNNSESAFEQAKDKLLSSDPEILAVAHARDREARANTCLKNEINEIKNYKNEVEDLEGLLGVINVKLRNLARLNMDIKAQLRLMESQIKLGSLPITDDSVKNLMAELSKSDLFQNAQTKIEESVAQDPTQPLDINSLLPVDLTVTAPVINNPSIPSSVEINNPSIPEKEITGKTGDAYLATGVQESKIEKSVINLAKNLEEEALEEESEEIIDGEDLLPVLNSSDLVETTASEVIDLDKILGQVGPPVKLPDPVLSCAVELPIITKPSTIVGGVPEQKIELVKGSVETSNTPDIMRDLKQEEKPKEGTEFDLMLSQYLSQFNTQKLKE
jgi:hypothetical protein